MINPKKAILCYMEKLLGQKSPRSVMSRPALCTGRARSAHMEFYLPTYQLRDVLLGNIRTFFMEFATTLKTRHEKKLSYFEALLQFFKGQIQIQG